MVNAPAGNEMDINVENNQHIPGGKQQTLPEEPSLAAESSNKAMGCTTTKAVEQPSDTENKTNPKNGQTNITDYLKPTAGGRTPSPNKPKTEANNVSNKRISSPSSDDDMDDGNGRWQRSTMNTRSSSRLSRISVQFNNSDDEENTNSRYHSWSKRDVTEYRDRYPCARDDLKINANYKFYTNQISSYPDGDLIDNIHKKWFGDYRLLERHHGYIQWLFPIQEKGLNWSAEPLQKHEIESIKKDPKALKRLLKSYKLMLDFYGFELVNEQTGEIRRTNDESYRDRFRNLNTSSHNYLRITRILKCLGEFEYERLKFGFLAGILREAITENTLSNCLRSCKDYWIETLRSKDERRAIRQYATELIEYRNKEMNPPPSHRAIRPSAAAAPETGNNSMEE